jgi:hypothetical protein
MRTISILAVIPILSSRRRRDPLTILAPNQRERHGSHHTASRGVATGPSAQEARVRDDSVVRSTISILAVISHSVVPTKEGPVEHPRAEPARTTRIHHTASRGVATGPSAQKARVRDDSVARMFHDLSSRRRRDPLNILAPNQRERHGSHHTASRGVATGPSAQEARVRDDSVVRMFHDLSSRRRRDLLIILAPNQRERHGSHHTASRGVATGPSAQKARVRDDSVAMRTISILAVILILSSRRRRDLLNILARMSANDTDPITQLREGWQQVPPRKKRAFGTTASCGAPYLSSR